MGTLSAYIKLTRPLNLIIAFLSIFLGGVVSGSIDPLFKLLTACFSGTLIMAGANAINDYFDRDIDRINRPKRPIPAGQVLPLQAKTFALLLFTAGTFCGFLVHLLAGIIAVLSSVLLYYYSCRFKRMVLIGNFVVALMTALAFVYGGLAVGRVTFALIVGLFAFLFHLAREIIKDIEDIEGDEKLDLRTFPIVFGEKAGLRLVTAILGILMILTLIPYMTGLFSRAYLWTVMIGVNLFLCIVMVLLWRAPQRKVFRRVAFAMKIDMFLGLLAVFLGR